MPAPSQFARSKPSRILCFPSQASRARCDLASCHATPRNRRERLIGLGTENRDLPGFVSLGFDHERLTYRYSGRDFRLTDVHGEVVQDLLA